MEYVYAALILHKLEKEINEENLKNVIKATGIEPNEVKIKSLVASLSEINIEEALKATAAPMMVQQPAQPDQEAQPKTEEKPKEEKKEPEENLTGLSSLFG
jgi:large subunit ribosomal protein L12